MYLVVSSLIFSVLIRINAGQCSCSIPADGPLIYSTADCSSPLTNNSAVLEDYWLKCCANVNGTNSTWYDTGNRPVEVSNVKAVRIDPNHGSLVVSTGPVNNVTVNEGIYTCVITNDTTNEVISYHYVGIYHSIGTLEVTDIQLFVLQYHPIIIGLTFNTSHYPPTNVFWSKEGTNVDDCVMDRYSYLVERETTTYNNVLVLDSSGNCNLEGTYFVSLNTNGSQNITLNKTISKYSSSIQSVNIVAMTEHNVTVTWNEIQNSLYHLILNDGPTDIVTSSNVYTIPVTADTNYTLLYFASSKTCESNSINCCCLLSDKNSLFFNTNKPYRNDNISVIAYNSTAIQITMTGVVDTDIPIHQVLIHIYDNCTARPYVTAITPSRFINNPRFMHTLVGLQPATEYCIRVSLKNPWGSTNYTQPICINTPSTGITAPSKGPASIYTTNAGCYNNTIAWDPIECNSRNGLLSHYVVNLYNDTNCNLLHYSFNTTITRLVNISNIIRPFSPYCIKIARVNLGDLQGPFGQAKSGMTAECVSDAVSGLIINTTLIAAVLSWKPPANSNGELIDYQLCYNDTISSQICQTSRTNISRTDNLLPSQRYIFSIQARNSVGLSDPTHATIETKSIERINVISADWTSNTQVMILWNRAYYATEVSHYLITYAINDPNNSVLVPGTNDAWTLSNITTNPRQVYSFSVAAVVDTNGMRIIGENGRILLGCYGDCSDVGRVVGGSIAAIGVVVIIIIIIIVIIILSYKRFDKKVQVESEMEMVTKSTGIPPEVVFKSNDVTTRADEDIALVIEVSGDPTPIITWSYENRIIADDEHYDLEEENKLIINRIAPKHAGVYSFIASNSSGSVEGQIRVFVERAAGADEIDAPHTPHIQIIDMEMSAHEIPMQNMMETVGLMNKDGSFKQEFLKLQAYNFLATEMASDPDNLYRNRFKAVLPYDDNLVKLKPMTLRSDCSHTYINASYIDGFAKKKQFIATQGPLPQTLADFWRCIWQNDICCIVMLLSQMSDGSTVRCQQYWPDSGSVTFYGPFRVTVERIEEHKYYKERQMLLSMTDVAGNPSKVVYHYQFNFWPKDGVPDSITSILSLYDAARVWFDMHSPVVVHCSSGNGPTAVLLAIIIAYEQSQKEGKVDVMSTVNRLRSQRMNMIQTEEQYKFIYHTLLQMIYSVGIGNITAADFSASCNTLESYHDNIDMTGYEAHFKTLQVLSLKPSNVLRKDGLSSTLTRSKKFLPPDKFRVILDRPVEDGESYIHASYLNGYNNVKEFIIAESPTKSTAGKFWQMIVEQECSVIVMLCNCVEKEIDTCYPYWPAFTENDKYFDDYQVNNYQQQVQDYTETIFRVKNIHEPDKVHMVTQIQISNWAPDGECSNPGSLLAAIKRIENIQRTTGNHPIVVHCSDTVTRTGIFCTLYTAIQQMKTEQAVNVYEIVTILRVQKPGLLVSPSNYRMVYKLLHQFLTDFDTYGNFSSQTLHQNLAEQKTDV